MNHAIVEAIGWALIHSLWECAGAAFLFAVVVAFLRGANARYIAGCLTLLLMLGAPVGTVISHLHPAQSEKAVVAAPAEAPVAVAALNTAPSAPRPYEPPFLAIAVWLWIAGVMAMSLWQTGGWLAAQRLKRAGNRPASEISNGRIAALSSRLGIRRVVRAYESAAASVPAVVGCFRPVILVPVAALIHLSPEELEAVLAHELAHIRRFDYLANLLQASVETLLFYHPAVWWVGKCVRAEREHCCDDIAVRACGDRLIYARALTSLEELRCAAPAFAVAATGGELRSRIQRLLGRQPARRGLPVFALGVASLAAAMLPFATQHASAYDGQARNAAPPTVARPHGEGYLAGLADANYTHISVDEIIELKQNGVNPKYIKDMLQAGFGVLAPQQLIALHNNGVAPEYARAVKASGIRDVRLEDVVRMHQYGVRPDLLEALAAAGYRDVTVAQVIEAQTNGLSAGALRRVKEQGFKSLTFEQVIKLKRAGVI
jgi:beta-lactamase regulating signal transducer with metallopeptidase domain